jgi:murein DD-endopeptidase MepM/ murein hydrolase activator NlpD
VGCSVAFPLRGEWVATNTPAFKVPSHGTDYFGQRYAYDFIQLGDWAFYRTDESRGAFGQLARHALAVLPASEFLCWNEPVYSVFAGRVVSTGDGWPDRLRVNVFRELLRVSFASDIRGQDYRPLAGNYVFVEGSEGVAVFAHLRNGSVRVRAGDTVAEGAQLGNVGNSGNTTMPHLHFHVMDGPDPLTAAGVMCTFRRYERRVKDVWEVVERGVPGRDERIRGLTVPVADS